jgi:hypothetical protein
MGAASLFILESGEASPPRDSAPFQDKPFPTRMDHKARTGQAVASSKGHASGRRAAYEPGGKGPHCGSALGNSQIEAQFG